MKEKESFRRLYKMYNEKEYNFKSLINEHLFLSKPSFFNDPFDCFVAIDVNDFYAYYYAKKLTDLKIDQKIINDVRDGDFSALIPPTTINKLSKIFKCKTANNIACKFTYEQIKKIDIQKWEKEASRLLECYRKAINKIRDSYYVACFTIQHPNKNMVMWSHYANNYKGFCVGFDFSKIIWDMNSPRKKDYDIFLLKKIKKVLYSEKFIKLETNKLFQTTPENLNENKYVKEKIRKSLIYKYSQWKYEKEYRLILSEEEIINKNLGLTKSNGGYLIHFPYVKEIYIHNKIKKTINKKVDHIVKKLNISYYSKLTTSNGAIIFETKKILNTPLMLKNIKNEQSSNTDFPF